MQPVASDLSYEVWQALRRRGDRRPAPPAQPIRPLYAPRIWGGDEDDGDDDGEGDEGA